MTSILFQDFNERSKEVSKYFMLLKSFENGSTKLCMEGKNTKKKIKNIDTDLANTLKASAFLLLYNLVESTMRNAIEAIFYEFQIQGISFDKIKPEIKKIILQNFKKRDTNKILNLITDISIDIINISFNKQELFSGNIDSKLIEKTAEQYGFSSDTDYQKTKHGHDLLTIKTNRNYLAHGNKSFAEIGKERSADELLKIQKKVVRYLRQILINIEKYLANQEYLDKN
jgi:hypothetical protein